MRPWLNSFRFRLTFLFGGLSLAIGLGFLVFIERITTDYMARERGAELQHLAQAIAVQLESNLLERSREITLLAASPGLTEGSLEAPRLRGILERIQRTHPYYAWVGIAGPDGQVLNSANGLLAGANVAQRPWFVAGQRQAYVGDVHEALMLARLLPSPVGGEPLRFVDFVAPIHDDKGRLRGVLGAHFHWSWIERLIRSMLPQDAVDAGIQAYVLSRDNTILHPHAAIGVEAVPADLPRGSGVAQLAWGGQQDYLTAVTPLPGQAAADLGWKVVVRQSVTQALAPVAELQRSLMRLGLLATLGFMALAYLLAWRLSRPLEMLARFAHRVQNGQEDHLTLPVRSRTSEIQRLMESLQAMTHTLLLRRDRLAQASATLELRVAERTAELKAARNRFRAFVQRAPIAMAVLEDGHLTLRNEQFVRLFGYTEADLPSLDDWWRQAYPDPAYRHSVRETWSAAVALGEAEDRATTPVEYRVCCRDGSVRNVEVSGVSLEGVFLTTFFDVTDRRRTEAALREREHFLHTIADAVPGMVGYWTAELRCRFANIAYLEWFGRRPEEMRDMSMQELLGTELFADREAMVQGALAGQPQRFDRDLMKADGEARHTRVHYIPDLVEGETRGFFVLVLDVTDLKRTQHHLQEAKQLAESASKAKSEFLANMSHEIRTPMNAILGTIQVLARSPLNPEQQHLVGTIHTASRGMLAIINDVLDFSRIEAGHFELDPEPFVLDHVMSHLIDVLAASAADKHLRLILAPLPAGLEGLVGDAQRLAQVLYNLVGNAIKFTARGAVTVTVRLLQRSAQRVVLGFAVGDTGIGIAPSKIERLFEAFVQADSSIRRQYGGSGLGLAICRQLVTLMGGEIGVDSRPGEGSEFWFVLPFEIAAAGATAPAVALQRVEQGVLRLAGLRLLVVDDSSVNQEVARRLLEIEGARVEVADNGLAAIARLEATPGAFDLVLMDVQMPLLDGLGATRRIRQELGLATLPIIALTAGVLPSQRDRAFAAGMNGFLTKPFELDLMVAVILRHAGDKIPPGRPRLLPPGGPTAAFPALPGIDGERAAQRYLGDLPLFRRALAGLAEEFADVVARALPEVARGDFEAARQRLHKLKGVAGNLAAEEIARLAGELEDKLAAREREGLADLFDHLGKALAELLAHLPADPAPAAAPDEPPAGAAPEVAADAVQRLLAALAEHNMDALGYFEALQPALAARFGRDETARLADAIDGLRFGEAEGCLRGWYALL